MSGMIEPWEGAQTSLHCLLADEVENGAFYSQLGKYRDKAADKGGWPLQSPNPASRREGLVDALWNKSAELVGLDA